MKLLDEIDTRILLALEKDARISLKQLARSLGIKTSTIYHRLHRLQESNVLQGFTVVLNPAFLGIEKHRLLVIGVKNLLVNNLDAMFVSSFARYLGEHFPECLLVSVGEDSHVYVITAHASTDGFDSFMARLREIPYVGTVRVVALDQFVKGFRLHEYSSLRKAGSGVVPGDGEREGDAGEGIEVEPAEPVR